jgi:hypothetical protein
MQSTARPIHETEGFRADDYLRRVEGDRPSWKHVYASKLTSVLTEEDVTWRTAKTVTTVRTVTLGSVPRQLTLDFGPEAEVSGQPSALTRLEEAANLGDEQTFIKTLREIKWWKARPADFARAINLSIKAGLPRAARHVAGEGMKYYPGEVEIQEYARLFAPAKVLLDSVHSSNQNANIAWLKAHGGEYRGKWVALKDGQFLGAEVKLKELIQKIGNIADVMLTPSY